MIQKKNEFKELFKRKIFKDFSYNSGATVLAQLLNLVFIYITSQIFAPEAFGQYAVWFSLIALFTIFLNFRLELALVTEPNLQKSQQIIGAMTTLTLLGLFFTAVLLFFWSLYDYIVFENNIKVALLCITCVILTNVKQIGTFSLTKVGNFKIFSLLLLLNIVLLGSFQIILGFMTEGQGIGLLWALFLSLTVMASFYIVQIKKAGLLPIKTDRFNIINLKNILIEKKETTLWRSLLTFVETTYSRGIYLVLTNFIPASNLGQFNLAERIANAPTGVFSSISSVFFHHGAVQDIKKLEKIIFYYAYAILLFASVAIVTFTLLGDKIIGYFFGEQWIEAGSLVGIILIGQSTIFLTTSFTRLPDIIGIQKQVFYLQALFAGLMITGLFFLATNNVSFKLIVFFYACLIAVYNTVWMTFVFKECNLSLRKSKNLFLIYFVLIISLIIYTSNV